MRVRQTPFRLAFALAASLHAVDSPAQTKTDSSGVQTLVDRRAIRLGDPAVLTLTITLPETSTLDASTLWSDTVPHVEWLSPWRADTTTLAGKRRISYTRGFTSFDSGRWVIPAPAFIIDGRRFSGDTVGVEVGTVPLTGEDYRDIGDILEAEEASEGRSRLLYALLVGLLLSAATWWLFRVRRRRREAMTPFSRSPEDAFSKAMSGLDALTGTDLKGDSGIRELHTSLYGILRTYLREAHGWRVSSLTTGDLLALLASHGEDRDELARVAGVLRLSDAVRFARHLPSMEESLRSVGDLRSFIRFIHETIRPA
jgi:hypothetical protein